jgi:hypothetical protein
MTMSDFTKTKYSMSAETRAFFAREDVRAGVAEIRAQVSDAQFAITGSGAYAAVSVYSPTLNRGCYWSPSLGADNALKYLTGGRDSGWHAREDCAAGIREGRALADENGEPIGGVKSLGAATVMPLTVSSNEQAEELFGKGSTLSKPFAEKCAEKVAKPDPYAAHREGEQGVVNAMRDINAQFVSRFTADIAPRSKDAGRHPWPLNEDLEL